MPSKDEGALNGLQASWCGELRAFWRFIWLAGSAGGLDDGGMLALLLRVNAVSAWRRLKTLGRQSRLLMAVVALFISGYLDRKSVV